MEQLLQESVIEGAQFLAEPLLTGQGLLCVNSIGSRGIQMQMEAQFDDEQGMSEQKAAQLTGVNQALTKADEKGFEVGALGMRRSPTRRAVGLPVLNEGPIEQGRQGAVIGNERVIRQESRHRGLVKESRGRYHSTRLLL